MIFKQYDAVVLLEDLNEVIKAGMMGYILEIWDEENVEVEFVKEDGTNYEYEGDFTFAIPIKNLKLYQKKVK